MTLMDWLNIATAVITAGATVATITPTKSDNKIFKILLRVINFIGLNFGKARNADDD